ncbi:MAG: DUF4139 domain-containing protein [Paludibacteraceae bacterium]|nr:DUF4139 domain-containing protein [Paludibacteraceae bacterium]
MKRYLSLVSVAAIALCAFAAEKPVVANPVEATVFINGAELTHKAVLPLKKGVNEVRIEGISPKVDRNSIQVSLSDGVVISAFEYSVDYLSADRRTVNTKLLQDSIEQYQAQVKKLDSDLQTNKTLQDLLQTGVSHSINVDRVNVTSETIEKNLNYYQQRAQKLAAEKTSLEKQKTFANERIAAIKKQLQQDGTKDARRSGVLNLSLISGKQVNANVTISYFTNYAYWTPFYDINVTETNAPMLIVMKANVAQTTGLDWKDVKLTLSTGTPSKSNTVPEFSTWFLRQQQAYVTRQMASGKYNANLRPMMKAAVAEDAMVMDVEEEVATVENYITTTEQTLNVEYAIDLPYTILGNGKQQTVGLVTKKVDNAVYNYYAAPKLSSAVFLRASVPDYQNLSLLDGNANITYAGTFYGQTFINASSSDEVLKLTLGEDKQIAVKREKAAEMSKTKTVGSNKSVTQTYTITVKNNKKRSVVVTIGEQYPVSTAKEIQVELTDKTTNWTKNDTDRGLLSYELSLEPGEQKVLTIGYTVKYPKDWNVNF